MIIKGYGIELERLTKADIELVRYWRNSERINRFMEFRGYITPEMQEAWFHSIDTPENNYFIIRYNGEKVGLIHGSQLDWKEYVTRNGGIFIWDESLWNTLVPLSAAFLLTEISFIFGMKKTYAKILRSNTNSIAFNRQLGYVLAEGQETQENQQYVLTPEAFYEKTKRLRAALQKATAPGIHFMLDIQHPSSAFVYEHLRQIPEERRKDVTFEVTR